MVSLAGSVLPAKAALETAGKALLSHTAVFSNVPGPQSTVYIAGAAVSELQAFMPNIPLQLMAISYNGEVHMTWVINEGRVKEPERLSQFFLEEIDALKQEVTGC